MSLASRLDTCLDALYASVCDPSRLPVALDAIRVFTDAGSCTIASFDAAGDPVGLAATGLDLDRSGAWLRYYADIDPRRPIAMKTPAGQWVADDRLLDPLHSPSREYANDFALPMGMRWMRGGKVYEGPSGSAVLCIQRPGNARAFDAETLQRLDMLLPHVRRASGLMRDAHMRLPAMAGAVASLDLLDIPLCVVDQQARVLHSNRAGEDLLVAGKTVTVRQGRLAAASVATDRLLREAIRNACTPFPRQASAFTLQEPAPPGTRPAPLWIRILPLPLMQQYLRGASEPHALVLLERGAKTLDRTHLHALFGLSRTEAELVVLLAAGHPAKSCARLRGVGLATVRTQIASVLAKTGTGTQAQLMALLGSLTSLR